MRIGITGGSGAIGSLVCNRFIRAGHEVTSLDLRPPTNDVRFVKVDLCDLDQTCKTIRGFDQVIHLAAIPNPFNDPADRVMAVNVPMTFNVFEASRRQGIHRVVNCCSESSTGFGLHNVKLVPRYLPIDEDHPCWPHETYSLSKHLGECIGRNYAIAYGLEVISLRYAWVWDRRDQAAIRQIINYTQSDRVDEDKLWFGAYILPDDVARACVASAQFRFPQDQDPPFEAFFLTAACTFYPRPTLEIMRRLYRDLPPIKDQGYFDDNPRASVFDIRKAQRLLGWKPQLDMYDYESQAHKDI